MTPVLRRYNRRDVDQGDIVLTHHDVFWWVVIHKNPETQALLLVSLWTGVLGVQGWTELWDHQVSEHMTDFFPRVLQMEEWI